MEVSMWRVLPFSFLLVLFSTVAWAQVDDTYTVSLSDALAAPGQVVIGPETRRLLGDAICCESMGTVTLKGRSQEVEAWLVTSIKDASE